MSANKLDTAMKDMGCFKKVSFTIATSEQFMRMAEDSAHRNQGPKVEKLRENIDPEGFHVLNFQIPHNDVEWRTIWYVKIIDRIEPIEIVMDVGFECFKNNHSIKMMSWVEVEEMMENAA